eukprot:gene1859-2196_t
MDRTVAGVSHLAGGLGGGGEGGEGGAGGGGLSKRQIPTAVSGVQKTTSQRSSTLQCANIIWDAADCKWTKFCQTKSLIYPTWEVVVVESWVAGVVACRGSNSAQG